MSETHAPSERPAPFGQLPGVIGPSFAPFFAGLAQGRVLVPRCGGCGRRLFPPREVCPHCQDITFVWDEVGSQATVYTFVVSHRAFHPWFADRLPYAVVVGELTCGLRILGCMLGPDVASVACGVPIRAEFVPVSDVTILEWRLDT